jgi:hypothetical protein
MRHLTGDFQTLGAKSRDRRAGSSTLLELQ